MKLLVPWLLTLILTTGPRLRAQDQPPKAPAAVQEAHEWGELYESILADAWAGDTNALGAMFGYEDQAAFHGKAVGEHHRVLWALLQHLGDERFATALGGEVSRIRETVVRALMKVVPSTTLRTRFPRTYATGIHT